MLTTTRPVNYSTNRFLAALPAAYYQRQLFDHLQPCLFHLGDRLYSINTEVESVFFLKSGLISMVMEATDGVHVEVGLIGFEGAVGGVEALTGLPAICTAQVQIAGSGWRVSSEIFRRVYQSNGALQNTVLRYQHYFGAQTAYNTFCNRRHGIEQRLSRWLLLCHDRVQSDNLPLTHEFLATMLGTRRAAVSIAANQLRQSGFIDYHRGEITIRDRAGLEQQACGCYAAVRAHFDRLVQ